MRDHCLEGRVTVDIYAVYCKCPQSLISGLENYSHNQNYVGENVTQIDSRPITKLSCKEARAFFLKQASYFSNDLPNYFSFDGLLEEVSKVLQGKKLSDLWYRKPRQHENVDYLLLDNKDGRYSWRPLELIHPALYVSLVDSITRPDSWDLILKRLNDFASNPRIRCLSLPVESLSDDKDKAAQVDKWWREIEQKSIEQSLDYELLIHTDIVDCYPSIYTHSISWALHTKPIAKKNPKDKRLIGNVIDDHIQDMRYGQTNGIPQGSVLMDFIAEIVLGYADSELTDRLCSEGVDDYQILRYRDDDRVFVNSQQDGERILRCMIEAFRSLGFTLSSTKTKFCEDMIASSLKPDKLSWLLRKQGEDGLQKHLLIVHDHSVRYPNSGSLTRALSKFYRRIHRLKEYEFPLALVSIAVDIALRSPRNYPVIAAIIGALIRLLSTTAEQRNTLEKIRGKFSQHPNTGQMEIWLQRISLEFASDFCFDEPLCKIVQGQVVPIWNNDWIQSKTLLRAVDSAKIIDQKAIEDLSPLLPIEEVELFSYQYS